MLLTIGQIARETGVQVATLREWERRHGFPVPERLPSGHRRYTPDHVAQVREVLRRQGAGQSLRSAIAARRAAEAATPAPLSLFAAAADAIDRPPARRSRPTMLAISRAIEDACAASGDRAVLVGSFQREAVFRGCERRWRELARGAGACVVLADFAEVRVHDGIVEVPVPDASPLRREWAIAVAAPRLTACLAGWEWPGRADRCFEAHWSVEPDVVAAVVGRGLELGRRAAPGALPDAVGTSALDGRGPADARVALAAGFELFDRILAHVQRVHGEAG